MVIHFLEFLVVLWGESSVSAVQEGEGRQETGKLFMKGRESERGGSTEEYERATLCKQQREERKGFLS